MKSRIPVRVHTKTKSVCTHLQAVPECLRHCQETVRWSIVTVSTLLVISAKRFIPGDTFLNFKIRFYPKFLSPILLYSNSGHFVLLLGGEFKGENQWERNV